MEPSGRNRGTHLPPKVLARQGPLPARFGDRRVWAFGASLRARNSSTQALPLDKPNRADRSDLRASRQSRTAPAGFTRATTHPAHIPVEVAGSTRPHPRIPARPGHTSSSAESRREFVIGADDCVSSDARARNALPWTLAFTGRGHSAPTWAGLPVSSLAGVCRGRGGRSHLVHPMVGCLSVVSEHGRRQAEGCER
jgi:hypothetical protein